MRYRDLTEPSNAATYDELLAKYPEIKQDLEDVGKWFKTDPTKLSYTLTNEPMSKFRDVAQGNLDSYEHFPKEAKRTAKITKLLKSGARPLPIFVDNEDGFILEGRHRVVAFLLSNLETIPVVTVFK